MDLQNRTRCSTLRLQAVWLLALFLVVSYTRPLDSFGWTSSLAASCLSACPSSTFGSAWRANSFNTKPKRKARNPPLRHVLRLYHKKRPRNTLVKYSINRIIHGDWFSSEISSPISRLLHYTMEEINTLIRLDHTHNSFSICIHFTIVEYQLSSALSCTHYLGRVCWTRTSINVPWSLSFLEGDI